MAAVLAAGTDAVLSHITAGGAWVLRPLGAGLIHVTVPGDGGRKRRPGIRIHRSRTLTPSRHHHPPRHPHHHPHPHHHRPRQHPRAPPARASARPSRPPRPDRLRRTQDKADPALPTSHPGPLHRPDLHPQRTRRPLPRALRQPRPAAADQQHHHRRRRSRLRLAQTAPDRRGRRLRLPPLPVALRERPRTRRHAHPRRLDRPALHLDPSHRPAPTGSPARSPSGWPSVADLTPRAGGTALARTAARADTSGHGRARRSSRPCADPGRATASDRGRRAVPAAGLLHGDRRADGQRHRRHAVAHARAADRRLPGRPAHVRVCAPAGGARAPPCRARARRPDRRRLPAAARRPPPRAAAEGRRARPPALEGPRLHRAARGGRPRVRHDLGRAVGHGPRQRHPSRLVVGDAGRRHVPLVPDRHLRGVDRRRGDRRRAAAGRRASRSARSRSARPTSRAGCSAPR